MKFIISLIILSVSSLVFSAVEMSSSTTKHVEQRLPSPTVTCISLDNNWKLYVYHQLGLIKVFDIGQQSLSHTISGLKFVFKENILLGINKKNNNDLPSGVIFNVDTSMTENNAYSINDYSGSTSRLSCKLISAHLD